MHVLEYLHRNVKTVAMPTAMVVGALLCRPVTALEGWTHQMITPSLIFLMLFVTFCRVKPRQMKPSMLHFWLLLFQVVVSVAVYFLLLPLNPIVAQGAMICVLAPVAMAAVVIAGMLGANVPTMATYSLVCNMVIALVAPVVLSLAGTGACSFTQILARIAPLLIMPFAAAQFCRFVLPGAAKWIGDHSQISFYMWLVSLVVIIGRTTAFILDLHDASPATGLWIFRFSARGRGVDFSFSCPRPGPWVSAPNLLTKIPALFEKRETRGHQSVFLAHFTYKSLLWRRKTGTGSGVDVI